MTPPDLSGAILAHAVLPARRIHRYRLRLRVGLALLGVLQWALAVQALLGDAVGMPMAVHASHESAAWSVALGAAFLAVAIRPIRAQGTLPILATFVAVLGALSISDLADRAVSGARLASHLGVVAGLLLTALCARSQRLVPPGREADGPAVRSPSAARDALPGTSGRRGPRTGGAPQRRRGAA